MQPSGHTRFYTTLTDATFAANQVKAKHIAKECARLIEIGNGKAHMVDAAG
jgi:hypothetical protein